MTTTTETVIRIPTRLGALHARILGDGPTVVCWPSMFVDGHTFDTLAHVLALDHRVVIVDGPGLGLSDPLTRVSSIEEASEAAVEMLTALDAGAVDWLGNAFGGHVGLKLARREGLLRSLVAVSSPVEPISPELQRKIRMLLPILKVIGARGPIRGVIRRGDADRCVGGRSAHPGGARRVARATDASAAWRWRSSRSSSSAPMSPQELADIRVPSLFVASDDRGDWAPEDAAASAAATPLARAVTVHGARTLVPLEQPQALHAHIRAFWNDLED